MLGRDDLTSAMELSWTECWGYKHKHLKAWNFPSFADDKDNRLDSQDFDDTKALVIHDGMQTLKSGKLGGDVLIAASKNGRSGQSQLV